MSDQERFEARFEAAYARYLEGAPVAVEPRALSRAITAASRPTGASRLFTVTTTFRLILVAALVGTASLAISLSAGQIVVPQSGCATPLADMSAPSTSASPGEIAPSPVEFLWSATGPTDDPMRFSVSDAGRAAGGHVALDRDCRVWVADTGHDRFAIFRPDGSFVEYWGSTGTGDGQFNLRATSNDGIGAVAFAPDGSFYVLDVGNDRVQHFGPDRGFLGTWGGPGTKPGQYILPDGIAVDEKGLVHVLDDTRDVVETYDKDGKVVDSFTPSLSGATNGLTLDPQGDVYIAVCCAAGNEVRKFAPDGAPLTTIGALGSGRDPQMTGVAVDAAGRVFAVATGPAVTGDRIRVYDPDGTFLASFGGGGSGDGEFGSDWIVGLAFDGQSNVYLTDPGLNRLQKFHLLSPLWP